MLRAVSVVIAFTIAGIAGIAGAAEKVSLPRGYEKWEKSREKVNTDKSSLFYGIHHIYVDAQAMKAYKVSGVYPEGSRFVVEQFKIVNHKETPVKGKKEMIVMMKRDNARKETGGWLFAGFTADGKPSGLDPVKNCFKCHEQDAAESHFIISKFSDFR